ncbi:hypothetical protein CEK25_002886 [Fusarium fujikuroi]|nr:hypothetical protein CEK25_002886 [Fusarium fujikuroi]
MSLTSEYTRSASDLSIAQASLAIYTGSANALAIYQASQAIYDLFDKAKSSCTKVVRESTSAPPARPRLTSVTNPQERKAGLGMENKARQTAGESERLRDENKVYRQEFPTDNRHECIEATREIEVYQQDYHRHEAIAPLRERKAKFFMLESSRYI